MKQAKVPAAAILEHLTNLRDQARTSPRVTHAAVYRCPNCTDTGWVEVNSDGRGTVKRCVGPKSVGCPAVAHQAEKARKDAARDRIPKGSGERQGL